MITSLKFSRIDSVYFVFFSQGSAVLYGGSFLLFVPFTLSPIEQGFWFTMLSLGAMSRLADMGFMNLLLTYVGYTRAVSFKYTFNEVYDFSVCWRNKILKVVFPIIFLVGLSILYTFKDINIDVLFSWLLYVVALSVLFYSVHKIAIIEGLGLVRQAHFFRGMIFSLAMLFTAVGLLLFSTLYALAIGLLLSLIISLMFLVSHFNSLDVCSGKNLDVSSELQEEFMVLLKKTAGSWTGGYLGTHGIIPLIYILSGPVMSGLAGVTLNVFMAIQNFSNSFMVSKVPGITYLMAKRKYLSVKIILKSSLIKALMTYIFICFLVWGSYYVYFEKYFTGRLLDDYHLLYLFIGFLLQIFISAIAIYTRAKKKELFSSMSMVTGFFGLLILFFSVVYIDVALYFLGFLVSSFVALIWALIILKKEVGHYE